MWDYTCLMICLLELTTGMKEVLHIEQTEKDVKNKGCLQVGPFFSEDVTCIKSWEAKDQTGIRLGDGTTCWHKTLPTAVGLKCSNGMWKSVSGLSRKKRAWFWSCPRDVHVTAERGKACATSGNGVDDYVRCYYSDSQWHYTQWLPPLDCVYHIRVTVHHCSLLRKIRHGLIRCKGADAPTIWGSVCTTFCNYGYYLQGAATTECTVVSNTPRWSNDFPSCVAHLCPQLPVFSNGNRSCYGGHMDIAFGSSCNHVCKEGYRLRGSSSVQCITESTSALWNASFPICETYLCPPLPIFPNGSRYCYGGDYDNAYGSNCSHVCNEGYRLKGTSSVQCITDPTSALWSNSLPFCEPHICSPLPTFLNGNRSCYGGDYDIAYGSRCWFVCYKGYHLIGDSVVQCIMGPTSALWNNSIPFCKFRRRSVTSPYQTTTPPRTESDKSSSKTSSYNEVDDLELTARIREEADSVEYTRPSPPTAHAHSTRTALSSHAERLIAVPQEAVTIEQAARAQQPEYVEIENEVRPNGDDGYLVPAGQYASLNPATRSEEGHEYENLGSRPTESSSTPGYSGLVKSTKREKHLYDRLRRETNQTIEAEEEDPTYAIALEQMPGPTFTKL